MRSIEEIVSEAAPVGFRTRYRSEPGMIGHYPWTYADHRRRKYDRPECEYENLFTDGQVRDLIASAIADARREGAEAMREAAAAEFDRRDGGTGIGFYDPHEPAEIVRALPLPTGQRQAEQPESAEWECKAGGLRPLSQRLYDKQPDAIKQHYTRIKPAVLLTDEQILSAMWAAEIYIEDSVAGQDRASGRCVEAAVLAANGLEVRRG